jgi:hypothetical protein
MFKLIDIGIIVLSSGMFMLLYMILLRKERFHQLNRFYLLFSLLFSSLLPFLRFKVPEQYSTPNTQIILTTVTKTSSFHFGMIFYVAGTALFFIFFLLKLMKVLRHILGKPFSEMNGLKVINHPGLKAPFSFFRYIVVDLTTFEPDELDLVLCHEAAHARQWHTLDLLFVELVGVVCWFNPFVWAYKSALKTVHEYAADAAVLHSNVTRDDYFDLILKQIHRLNSFALVHSFSAIALKSRIRMMSASVNGRYHWMRYLPMIPVLALLVVVNSLLASETSIPSAIENLIVPEMVKEQPLMSSVDEVSIVNHKKVNKTPRRTKSCPKSEENISQQNVLESQSWLSTQYGDPVEFYEEKPATKREVHYTVMVVGDEPQIYQVTTPRIAGYAHTHESEAPKAYQIATPENP